MVVTGEAEGKRSLQKYTRAGWSWIFSVCKEEIHGCSMQDQYAQDREQFKSETCTTEHDTLFS